MAELLNIITDESAWDGHVLEERGHILQTFAWGELKSRFGWSAERVVWREGEAIRGAAQILVSAARPCPDGGICAAGTRGWK